jgi:hypothetical protein
VCPGSSLIFRPSALGALKRALRHSSVVFHVFSPRTRGRETIRTVVFLRSSAVSSTVHQKRYVRDLRIRAPSATSAGEKGGAVVGREAEGEGRCRTCAARAGPSRRREPGRGHGSCRDAVAALLLLRVGHRP